jgi:hypothetical protein
MFAITWFFMRPRSPSDFAISRWGEGAVMGLSAETARYIVEGKECTKASRTLTGRLYDNIGNDF